ncbi:extracellular serine/threonine protein kinase four-jointed-like isoform X2 [Limulus polyphemus]|uniref:Extracellular serine/threonine protein kinase four-jointed-like isoform X2 n=1 Tax=Limulus polyphemus TaxID=6850 RepID=A0ABM1TH68_LIMPO|nr:extracellular serine/threonine protein kinase four-jointed-like isoform X2 [Limulus polyphemus]
MKVYMIRMYRLIAVSGFMFVTFLMVCTFITIQQKPFEYSKRELEVVNKESYFPRKLKRTYSKYEISNLPYYLLYRNRYIARANHGPIGEKDFKIMNNNYTAYGETAYEITEKSALEAANTASLRLHKEKGRTQNSRVIQGHQQEVNTVSAEDGVKKSFTLERDLTEFSQLVFNLKKEQQMNTLKTNTDSHKGVSRKQLLNGEKSWIKSINKLLIPFGIRVSSNTINSVSTKDGKVSLYKAASASKLSSVATASVHHTHTKKEIPKFQVPFDVPSRRSRTSVGVQNLKGIPVVEDDIFWSEEVDSLVSKGVTDDEVWAFIYRMRHLQVVQIEPPTWNRCGRPKNQYVTFQDGSHVCARYRAPHDYLIQGELLSFYLSRLLGIHNVPAVTLSVPSIGEQWKKRNVSSFLSRSGWTLNSTVALIQWVNHLERERMPKILLHALEKQQTISRKTLELRNLSTEQIVELAQWSDLIIFDYVTGNYDRCLES